MTPVRAKRNSKVPNRFSSDNSRIETSNANGETIIDYNDNSTSTTHNLAPISRAIKLKPVTREPLKVKLPKLKRHQVEQPETKEKHLSLDSSEIKIHKIKLPSFTKKSRSLLAPNKPDSPPDSSKGFDSKSTKSSQSKSQKTKSHVNEQHSVKPKSAELIQSLPSFVGPASLPTPREQIKKPPAPPALDTSTVSHASSEDKNTSQSFSSQDADRSPSTMEIVVSPKDEIQPSGSGIRCPCGVEDDLGVMVECELCSTWQHGHCINVGCEDDAYEGYTCAFCTLPPNRVHESLQQLTVNDKLQNRFKKLESLVKRGDSNNLEPSAIEELRFSQKELAEALGDLKRILSSVRVKMRLLTSELYQSELRIWQNSRWSDSLVKDSSNDTQLYFVDKCKNNLKLNVHNMIRKMKTRSRLVEAALSLNEKVNKDHSNPSVYNLRELNMEILGKIHDVESVFHEYVSANSTSNACDLNTQSK